MVLEYLRNLYPAEHGVDIALVDVVQSLELCDDVLPGLGHRVFGKLLFERRITFGDDMKALCCFLEPFSPPVAALILPGTALGGYQSSEQERGWIHGLLTGCDVNIRAWFPDGTPRFATLSIQFTEVVQLPDTGVRFHSRHTRFDDVARIRGSSTGSGLLGRGFDF